MAQETKWVNFEIVKQAVIIHRKSWRLVKSAREEIDSTVLVLRIYDLYIFNAEILGQLFTWEKKIMLITIYT